MKSSIIMVSVAMTTYNHESFIKEAIEGVLMQKADFRFELIIGEDCSTDKTREICINYQEKYPEIIQLILYKENVGLRSNNVEVWRNCKGKYIAYCEGDDYWTDPYKLQKQIDMLENDKTLGACFHKALIRHEGSDLKDELFPASLDKQIFNFDEVNEKWFVPTCSFVFRNFMLNNKNHPIFSSPLFYSDRPLMAFAAKEGDFAFIDEVMGCFRRHKTNMTKIGKLDIMYFEGAMAYKKLEKIYPKNKVKLSEQVIKWALWASKIAIINNELLRFAYYNFVSLFAIRSIYGLKTYVRYTTRIVLGQKVF